MTMLAPPPAPPRIAQGDHDGMDRLRLRMTQVLTTLVTVIVTAWLCTLGAIPAILAVMVAKHLELHDNDAQRSLAAVSSVASVRKDLKQIADAEVQASVAPS